MGRASCAKENLIKSAIELIGTRSYNAVGVQELCEHAGVKKGSFYHFFPSKMDLTVEALNVLWKRVKEEVLEPTLNSGGSAMDRFKSLLEKSYEHQSSAKDCYGCVTGCGIGNLALELSTQDEGIRKRLEEIFEEWAGLFACVIEEAVNAGELPPSTDPRATSQAMLAYIEGVSLLGKTFNDTKMMSRLGKGVLTLCIEKSGGSAD